MGLTFRSITGARNLKHLPACHRLALDHFPKVRFLILPAPIVRCAY